MHTHGLISVEKVEKKCVASMVEIRHKGWDLKKVVNIDSSPLTIVAIPHSNASSAK